MSDTICDECGREFTSQQGKRQHYTMMHRDSSTVDVSCSWCGSSFEKNHRHVESNGEYSIDNHFCDKECESQYKSQHWTGSDHPSWDGGNEEVTCEECGDTYEVKPSVVDKTRFCSRGCQTENQSEPLIECTCDWCSEKFKRKSHNIKGNSVFCSPNCFSSWMSEQREEGGNPQWRGGTSSNRGPNWSRQRRRCLSRDGYECRLCGKTRQQNYEEHDRDLEVHHKIPFRTFDSYEKANELGNLVVLCSGCHQDVEHNNRAVAHNDIRAPA